MASGARRLGSSRDLFTLIDKLMASRCIPPICTWQDHDSPRPALVGWLFLVGFGSFGGLLHTTNLNLRGASSSRLLQPIGQLPSRRFSDVQPLRIRGDDMMPPSTLSRYRASHCARRALAGALWFGAWTPPRQAGACRLGIQPWHGLCGWLRLRTPSSPEFNVDNMRNQNDFIESLLLCMYSVQWHG